MNTITRSCELSQELFEEKSDLIGHVVWNLIKEESARSSGRVLLQLVGMRPAHLLGIARHFTEPDGRSVKLAIADDIDAELTAALDPRFLTDKPAVYFRHYDQADIVIFAVTDNQRDTVGSSLGLVNRVDRKTIQGKSDLWLDIILHNLGNAFHGAEQQRWIESMLVGLDRSGITKELDQFAEFIHRFMSLNSEPPHQKLQLSAPALRLPLSCFGSIPSVHSDSEEKLIQSFRNMFRTADRDISGVPYLLDSKDARFDTGTALEKIAINRPAYTEQERQAADAIEQLIADRKHLRPGEWRPSQEHFCDHVDWDFFKSVFKVGSRKKPPSLSQRTREFINDEYPDQLDESTEGYLESLGTGNSTPEQDQEFFSNWQDVIRTTGHSKLYETWRRHLFTDEVKETDLLSTLIRGIRTLLIKNADDNGTIASNAVIVVRIKNAEKRSSWTGLNPRLVKLLQLEGQLIEATLRRHVHFEFGKWLDAEGDNTGRSASANQIEFELRLSDDDSTFTSQVRAFWQPGHQSMALSWPEDIAKLAKSELGGVVHHTPRPFQLRQSGAVGGMPAILKDTSSFIDVVGGDRGEMTDPIGQNVDEDVFVFILDQLKQSLASHIIDKNRHDSIAAALNEFQTAYSNAILQLHKAPSSVYQTDLIEKQAAAFGKLCELVHQIPRPSNHVRNQLMRPVVEFATVSADDHKATIVAAWHPLRLLERQAKVRDLANFIDEAIRNNSTTVDGLERAADEQQSILGAWFFPRVIAVNLISFVTVEDCGGYSLAVPIDSTVSNEQKLEASAGIACQQFMTATERFIDLNPHEEGNLSAALYNVDAVNLAGLVAKELEKRMSQKSHLRASLLLTHDDPARLRNIYAEQNTRLGNNNLDDSTEGFLSRLRVSVDRIKAANGHQRRNIDVVYLHEAFSKHARMSWMLVDGASGSLAETIDFRDAALPRRRTESGIQGNIITQATEIAMTTSCPPRAAAQFTDLCHIISSDVGDIPGNRRAVPIQRVDWTDQTVKRTIRRAHELGEWVVSVDTMSSRQMLVSNDIRVVRDVQLPDVDMRVLVSSQKPSESLLRYLRHDFEAMKDHCLGTHANILAQTVIDTVIKVCGQKILSSARSHIAAREIMGLAGATDIVCIEKSMEGKAPVWFSLDDNQRFFGLSGEMADTLAIVISKRHDRFQVSMTVVEAKCVQLSDVNEARAKSLKQVESTLSTIEANFVTQEDAMAKRAWGRQLLFLMTLRPEYIQFFDSNNDLEAFRQSVARGDVDYVADGRSIVVIYDDVTWSDDLTCKVSDKNSLIRQYVVNQRAFSRIMKHLSGVDDAEAPLMPVPPDASIEPSAEGNRQPELFASASTETTEASFPATPDDTVLDTASPASLQTDFMSPGSSDSVGAATSAEVSSHVVENGHIDGDASEEASTPTEPPTIESNQGLLSALENTLQRTAANKGYDDQKEAEASFAAVTARDLQAALTDFDMKAEFFSSATVSTPNGVLVNFAGHKTLTVARLTPKLLELKTTYGLDVVDIRTGLGKISLFVAARKRRVVDLARVWLETRWPDSAPESLSSFLLGLREDDGTPLWLNLRGSFGGNEEHSPHTLIAGETGSGKGVLTQHLLLQMIALNTPENLQLYLIDPKMGVDFPWISDAPHMARDIVTDQEESGQVLKDIVTEMDRRYELIKTKRVPKISEYNALVAPEERLPYIFVVHDEMADWMASSDEYRKMIQSTMTRLASKARACGIHVIMITQRAAQEAIPPGIRDNLGNRLILKVASEAGSKLALTTGGAERLLGKGHLAARLGGDKPEGGEYFVAQVPFASTEELTSYAQSVVAQYKKTR